MSSSGADWESILHLASTLACDAGAELRRRFGRQIVVTLKDELNPVTDADQAQSIMRTPSPILPSASRWQMRMGSTSVWSMIPCVMSCLPPSVGNQPG